MAPRPLLYLSYMTKLLLYIIHIHFGMTFNKFSNPLICFVSNLYFSKYVKMHWKLKIGQKFRVVFQIFHIANIPQRMFGSQKGPLDVSSKLRLTPTTCFIFNPIRPGRGGPEGPPLAFLFIAFKRILILNQSFLTFPKYLKQAEAVVVPSSSSVKIKFLKLRKVKLS